MTDTITHSGTDVSREQRRRRIALVASKGRSIRRTRL